MYKGGVLQTGLLSYKFLGPQSGLPVTHVPAQLSFYLQKPWVLSHRREASWIDELSLLQRSWGCCSAPRQTA